MTEELGRTTEMLLAWFGIKKKKTLFQEKQGSQASMTIIA